MVTKNIEALDFVRPPTARKQLAAPVSSKSIRLTGEADETISQEPTKARVYKKHLFWYGTTKRYYDSGKGFCSFHPIVLSIEPCQSQEVLHFYGLRASTLLYHTAIQLDGDRQHHQAIRRPFVTSTPFMKSSRLNGHRPGTSDGGAARGRNNSGLAASLELPKLKKAAEVRNGCGCSRARCTVPQ